MYDIQFTKKSAKDSVKIERSNLKAKVSEIITTIRNNPYEVSQDFEKLIGDLNGAYSRRINKQHRFVYEVLPNSDETKDANGELLEGIVKIISMWTHYE